MVAEDPSKAPDVWVVEFGENFDASLDQYEALLAMVSVCIYIMCVCTINIYVLYLYIYI